MAILEVMAPRCWYCGRAGLRLTDEHVLSEKNFGGRLVSRSAVCSTCNEAAGRIERTIAGRTVLAPLVARHSHLWRRRPMRPATEGRLADGESAHVGYTPDGPKAKWVREHEQRAARAPVPADRVTETRWGIRFETFDEWPRFGSKVALALASLTLETPWLDTPGAHALQAFFGRRSRDESVLPGLGMIADDLGADEPLRKLGPGEHALGLVSDPDRGAIAWMVFFGELHYEVPVPDADIPEGGIVWHLRPGRAPAAPTTTVAFLESLGAP